MINRFWRSCLFGVLAGTLAVAPAYSQGNSQGKGKGKGHDKKGGDDDSDQGRPGKYGFGPHDREVISSYYSNRGSNLPPGLAKRNGNLPPGLEKQLERNGTPNLIVDVFKDVAR